MAFCDKCGAIIAFAGGKCPRCGLQKNTAQPNIPSFGDTSKMALITKLERYKQLLGECEELKAMIKPQSEFPSSLNLDFKKRSFMRYFWPFLIGGIGGGYIVYMASAFIAMMSLRSYVSSYSNSTRAAENAMSDTFGGFIVAVIVAAIIIFFGVRIAKRKQADFNSNAEYMNRELEDRYNKGLNNQKMIGIYQENLTEMRQYEPLVPEQYRSAAQVSSILEFIKENKADNVDEAIILLG